MATLSDLRVHLDLSTTRLHDLINQGIVTRCPRGEYDIDKARKEYIAWIRKAATGRKSQGASDLSAERARLAKEQADAKEMENNITRGQLVKIEDVAKVIENQLDRCRTKMLAIPSKIAPESHAAPTPAEARIIIENAITDALNELVGYTDANT